METLSSDALLMEQGQVKLLPQPQTEQGAHSLTEDNKGVSGSEVSPHLHTNATLTP